MKALIMAYSKANLGDDLFVQILCNRYPNVEFTIVGLDSYTQAFKNIKNLKIKKLNQWHYRIDGVFSRLKLNFRLSESYNLRYAKKYDAVIHIGGSIFIENKNWKNKLYWYNKFLKANKNYFIIGSNFGPYYSEEYILEYQKFFKKVKDICFREEYSWKLFGNLNNTRFAPDVVFSLPEISSTIDSENKNIIISIINLKERSNLSKYNDIYINKLVDIINNFVNNKYKITLMGFCVAEGDSKISNRIFDKLSSFSKENVSVYNYEGNLTEALSLLSKSDGIMATRFHSMILGWRFGKKVFPIVYSDKTLNVIKDVNFDGKYSLINEIDKVEAEDLLKYFQNTKGFDVSTEILDAEHQFLSVDKFFGYK